MQSLKEFSIYTKKAFDSRDEMALHLNAVALGIDDKLLDENCGGAIASALKRKYKDESILFICGTGGKGAAGLSAARHMIEYADVKVAFLGDPGRIDRGATKFNYGLLSDLMDINCISQDNADELGRLIAASANVVDAIVGTGIKGRLSGFMTNVVKQINSSGKNVISIDIPTGLDPDTGMQNVACVRPSLLLVLHKMKVGVERGKVAGSVVVVDVGIPLSVELFSGPGDIAIATESRYMDANKYTHGNVLVVGGSEEYKGAPLLAAFGAENAIAALRVGSGYVTLAAPAKVIDICSRMYPMIVTKQLHDGDKLRDDVPAIGALRHDVMVVGPGLSRSEEVLKAVSSMLIAEKRAGKAVVIDATAIHALHGRKNLTGRNMVITPHDGEFMALTGISLEKCSFAERVKRALNFARDYQCTLVLKGSRTIITNGDRLKINRAATPALATMGTGDVLSGIIAGYASSHKDVFESAVAGVYAHSSIADQLYKSKGIHITAQDIVDAIPGTIKEFDRIK